jgi:hypothetical protein
MLRKLVVPVLVATTLILGAPLTAQAASLNLVDERGDVHRATDNGFVLAPGERRADILNTRIQHTDRALMIRTKLLDLRREGSQLAMAMRVRTNSGAYREVQLVAGRRAGWGGEASMNTRRGGVVECRIAHRINYATDVMAMRIPSSCLDNPRWVQMTLFSVFVGGRQFLADNPHNNTMRINGWTARIRRG